ncbi:putative glycophosphotransferase [Tieghemostelium lacteum]|uniref:Putative glycophosphotransferase n=1 Tax=Tieghemostelium lacteum TaxID=361077 RepID=A0A151Z4K9_TIELA|nr:putative glycophosphotransferase [Tieghemostelium lacteum]|eukprot:KYQ88878.1 putative glycophosphotransferase [Tieghemostelium lacteum]
MIKLKVVILFILVFITILLHLNLYNQRIKNERKYLDDIQKRKGIKPIVKCDKVDIVYTWVNGSDPVHYEKRLKRLNLYNSTITDHATDLNRFRDLDGLKYSLRSIKKYVQWINRIWIVTDDQKPTWLDEKLAKDAHIEIISHSELYRNHSHLPSFNSNSIESNFHSLPDRVANCFLYLNDDVYFNDHVDWGSDFFSNYKGQALYFGEWFAPKTVSKPNESWKYPIINSNLMLDRLFPSDSEQSETRAVASHGVQVYNRHILKSLYRDLQNEFEVCSSNSKRENTDIQLAFLYNHYTQKHYQCFTHKPINFYGGIVNDLNQFTKTLDQLQNSTNYKTACLNDGLSSSPNPKVLDIYYQYFNNKFPEPGTYEIID